jgi:hypothetical protein
VTLLHWSRRLLRVFVLATSFPPVLHVYLGIYRLVARLAVRSLRSHPEVQAIYLCRGGARRRPLPLLSDLDFAVVVEGMDELQRQKLRRAHERLARITQLIDPSIEIYDESTLRQLHATRWRSEYQFRFRKGKPTWKLLHGRDYLQLLPELTPDQARNGHFAELQLWWLYFTWLLLKDESGSLDSPFRSSICHKTVRAVLEMTSALAGESDTMGDGARALASVTQRLDDTGRDFVDRLEAIAARRFLFSPDSLVEETKNFLLSFLNDFLGDFGRRPPVGLLRQVSPRIEGPRERWLRAPSDDARLRRLVRHVEMEWGSIHRGAHVVTGCGFEMDELLLMLEVSPDRLPSTRQLRILDQLHTESESYAEEGWRIHIFLLLPNAAFQIDSRDIRTSSVAVLTPFVAPEVFELLGRSAAGGVHRPTTRPIWTRFIEDYFLAEEDRLLEWLQNPALDELREVDFLRFFWKICQLSVLNRSAASGELVYPLTPEMVRRELDRLGASFPERLIPLESGYRESLEARQAGIHSIVPQAITYLKELRELRSKESMAAQP